MMFHGDTEDSKAVIADRGALDPCFVLEDVVHRFCEQPYQGIALRRGNEYPAQF